MFTITSIIKRVASSAPAQVAPFGKSSLLRQHTCIVCLGCWSIIYIYISLYIYTNSSSIAEHVYSFDYLDISWIMVFRDLIHRDL